MGSSPVFKKTYEMHPSPPPPMKWEDYSARATKEWKELLDSPNGCDEKKVHQFLSQHPCMLPGAYSMTGPSGHGPFPSAVLSESPISGNGMKIPDFIWLAKDSLTFTPVFIEIESPCKPWFTKRSTPTSELTQAVNQLSEWRVWLNKPENLAVFHEAFEVPDYMRRSLNFRPEFVLIYGRRKEFEGRPEVNRLREQFERNGQVVMTFDRLAPHHDTSIFVSATKRQGRYKALAIPATFTLGPLSETLLRNVDGLPEAIRKNEWISAERRDFLLERLPYWTEWVNFRSNSIINTGDSE
jgi:hypothetical protein